jgi:hypothetical protein
VHGSRTIWVGFDERETLSYAVARQSLAAHCGGHTPVSGVVLQELIDRGWYTRPTEERRGVLWDCISEAPMSTQFAISRFFVLKMADVDFQGKRSGWALFVDSDVFARGSIDELFDLAEGYEDKALLCVPHVHQVVDGEEKKMGHIQLNYGRKNWSSVMLFNRAHPANEALDFKLLNSVPGRDLHRFCWLRDEDIGFLDVRWNHLADVVGCRSDNPRIVHYTNGGPWLKAYHDAEYADEWRAAMRCWAA